jgi:hypothetical protein
MVGSMMMGFADVPLEIRRARKSKSVLTPSSQIGEASELSNGTGTSHQPGSSIQISSSGTDQHALSSPARDGDRSMSKISSTNSVSSSETDFGEPNVHSIHSRGSNAMQLSPKVSEVSSSKEVPSKKDYRILQTSSGVAVGTSKALGKIIIAGIKSPFEVSLSAARGFHNVPRLYGDDTVRPHERITGVWSGLRVAGKVSTMWYCQ